MGESIINEWIPIERKDLIRSNERKDLIEPDLIHSLILYILYLPSQATSNKQQQQQQQQATSVSSLSINTHSSTY